MRGYDLISEESREELLIVYKDYFLEDEESYIHTINEFVKFYDKLPPERLMRTKYRQFLSRLMSKSKDLVNAAGDYKAILTNIPLYKHLHSILTEYDEDLKEIISFEDLFRNFNRYHKVYDVLDKLYNETPQISIRIKFVDFMNKVIKFYSHHEGAAYTEASLPRFEEYLKSKLMIEVQY